MSDVVEQLRTQGRVEDEDVYRLYLEHAPDNKREAFKEMYRTYHGGPLPAD